MNENFIIDENILLNARRGTDEDGNIASNERIFMYCFFKSSKKLPHTLNIRNQYYKIGKVGLNDITYQDVGLMKWFYQRLVNSDLCPIIDGLKIPKYKFIKSGDDEYVYLAIFRDGVLVSVDKRLQTEIEKEGLKNKVKCTPVKDALSLV